MDKADDEVIKWKKVDMILLICSIYQLDFISFPYNNNQMSECVKVMVRCRPMNNS